MTDKKQEVKQGSGWTKAQMSGVVLVAIFMIGLFIVPQHISGGFDSMINRAFPIVIEVGLIGKMSVSIILSVIMGRVLERLGFTDGLMRIFLPFSKLININAAILIPAIYNILGDINAAGRIAGPILKKSGASKDETKIAIATMMQSQQSFSSFMLGLACLTLCGAKVFLVVALAVFLPLLVVPTIMRYTLWRDCKSVDIGDLPSFTPDTAPLPTVFAAGQEGANTLFMLILPAFAVMFGFIGLLEYVGIWQYVSTGLTALLTFLNIDPVTGTISILSSPTLAMATLKDTLTTAVGSVDPKLVIGSFVLAASGFPLSVILGQIPVIWSQATDITPGEALRAALLGGVARLLTAGFFATVLTAIFF